MKRFFAVAALLLASSAAHAGNSFSFDIGGHTVRIDAPRNCSSTSCISISIPGVYESGRRSKRSRYDDDYNDDSYQDRDNDRNGDRGRDQDVRMDRPAPVANAAPVAPAPARTQPASESAASSVPAVGIEAPRRLDTTPSVTAPKVVPDAPAAASVPTVVANAPVAAPIQSEQALAPAKPSPLGTWITEKKEGKVRIEACGNNLCGYSIDAKTGQNRDKVLINMKPVNDAKWSGRIFDPNSGSTYDSTMALKSDTSLRVQGCAFGGMFCGGQTWSRIN